LLSVVRARYSTPRMKYLLACVLLTAGCSSGRPEASSDGAVAGADADVADAGSGSDGIPGLSILRKLGGLWSGPATMTPLGDFPLMNMDFRAADPRVLFARVDLDRDNSLRFAFSIENIGGRAVLVFRNGGQFRAMTRDTRTLFESEDEAAGRYRFCAQPASGGCGYVDATFTFSHADDMSLHVLVRGQEHLTWNTHRLEERTLPTPFPIDEMPRGNGDAAFPDMPALSVTVGWSDGLADEADVWVILPDVPCMLGSMCPISRWFSMRAPIGATQAVLHVDQIHAGDYKATVVLDRNRNLGATLAPDHGDGVSVPNGAVTIGAEGVSAASIPVVISL
jgi:hypothetical protein